MLKGIGFDALVTQLSHYYHKKIEGKKLTNRISIIIDLHEDVALVLYMVTSL
jgi:hypothetical protein